MAIVKTPLLSIDARGKLGKSLVYMIWKGINDVRQYVIPTNPQTPDQTAQRNIFRAAGDSYLYGTPPLTELDKLAWDRKATEDPRPLSGYNLYVSEYVLTVRQDQQWFRMYNGQTSSDTPGQIKFSIEAGITTATIHCYYSQEKDRSWNDAGIMTYDPQQGNYKITIYQLSSGKKYRIKAVADFTQDNTQFHGETGVYIQKCS